MTIFNCESIQKTANMHISIVCKIEHRFHWGYIKQFLILFFFSLPDILKLYYTHICCTYISYIFLKTKRNELCFSSLFSYSYVYVQHTSAYTIFLTLWKRWNGAIYTILHSYCTGTVTVIVLLSSYAYVYVYVYAHAMLWCCSIWWWGDSDGT